MAVNSWFRRNQKKVFIVMILGLGSCGQKKDAVGVVDLPVLYSEFQYQQELSIQFDAIKINIQTKLDSLERNIQLIESGINESIEYNAKEKNILFERAYVEYLSETQILESQSENIADDYSSKVWGQLNSYMKEYGDEKNYDVIIGMKGDGNVMYVKEGVNVTDDVIAYSNDKYNGR